MAVSVYVAYFCYAASFCVVVSRIWVAFCHTRPQGVNCEEPVSIPSKWPLQLDTFFSMKRAMREQQLMPYLTNLHEEYGKTLQSHMLGVTTLFTVDPQNIKSLLSSDFQNFELGPRNDILRPLIGHSIFTQDGKAWEWSRAFLRPHFAEPALLDTESTERHVQLTLEQLRGKEVVDMEPLMLDLISRIATELICGPSSDTQAEQEFAKAQTEAQIELSMSPQISQLKCLLPFGKTRRVLDICRKFMLESAGKALARHGCRDSKDGSSKRADKASYVLADVFAANCSNPVILSDQMHSLMFAGRDTMVRLLSWTFWCLSRYPNCLRKLKSDIKTAFGDNIPQGDPLKPCPYLEWTMKEVMRLYPPISINVRHALKDTYLPTGGGADGTSRVFVPKGCAVNYVTFALQRQKDLFGDDADQFRPERWVDPTIGHNYSYLPFSAGPRTCLGQRYAMRQCAYIIIRVLQHSETLKFAGSLEEKESYKLAFSLGMGKGCPVAIKLADS